MRGWEAWREYGRTCTFMGTYDTLGEAWCALRGATAAWEHGMLTDEEQCIQVENRPPPGPGHTCGFGT